MTSAEHFAKSLELQTRGIHVLTWEDKNDLYRAFIILRASLGDAPVTLLIVPTGEKELQALSIKLFEAKNDVAADRLRVLFIPQASIEAVGASMNGWRRQLAEPPSTLIVVRRADLPALYRRAPDLMSFVQSDVYEVGGMLPLLSASIAQRVMNSLPQSWTEQLDQLPGERPSVESLTAWVKKLRDNLD